MMQRQTRGADLKAAAGSGLAALNFALERRANVLPGAWLKSCQRRTGGQVLCLVRLSFTEASNRCGRRVANRSKIHHHTGSNKEDRYEVICWRAVLQPLHLTPIREVEGCRH